MKTFAIKKTPDHELLTSVARTALASKVHKNLAEMLTPIVVDAVMTVHRPGQPIDLHMVETHLSMLHKSDLNTEFVKGIVMDHGTRHPDMPKRCKNCFILTCNASLEYEKPEENAKV